MLDKKKYKKTEVETILGEYERNYENIIAELKAVTTDLKNENASLNEKLDLLQSKDGQVTDALKRAEKVAKETEYKCKLQYALTVERLKAFSERWSEYFNSLRDKYPMYPIVNEAAEIKNRLDELLKGGNNKKTVETLDRVVSAKAHGKNKPFDPAAKIQEYIAATGDNGFNIDDVLNPGDLELGDLCKELGILGEEE